MCKIIKDKYSLNKNYNIKLKSINCTLEIENNQL